jgi:hypothetical protein
MQSLHRASSSTRAEIVTVASLIQFDASLGMPPVRKFVRFAMMPAWISELIALENKWPFLNVFQIDCSHNRVLSYFWKLQFILMQYTDRGGHFRVVGMAALREPLTIMFGQYAGVPFDILKAK